MIVIDFELPEHNLPWFCSCRLFPTPEDAYAAFVNVAEADPTGSFGIGIYRHHRVGLDPKPGMLVSVVGLDREGVEKAEHVLGGEEIELHPSSWVELIKRRAEVVLGLGAANATSGRYRIVHEGEGMKM